MKKIILGFGLISAMTVCAMASEKSNLLYVEGREEVVDYNGKGTSKDIGTLNVTYKHKFSDYITIMLQAESTNEKDVNYGNNNKNIKKGGSYGLGIENKYFELSYKKVETTFTSPEYSPIIEKYERTETNHNVFLQLQYPAQVTRNLEVSPFYSRETLRGKYDSASTSYTRSSAAAEYALTTTEIKGISNDDVYTTKMGLDTNYQINNALTLGLSLAKSSYYIRWSPTKIEGFHKEFSVKIAASENTIINATYTKVDYKIGTFKTFSDTFVIGTGYKF